MSQLYSNQLSKSELKAKLVRRKEFLDQLKAQLFTVKQYFDPKVKSTRMNPQWRSQVEVSLRQLEALVETGRNTFIDDKFIMNLLDEVNRLA